jgi:hypothetical protein
MALRDPIDRKEAIRVTLLAPPSSISKDDNHVTRSIKIDREGISLVDEKGKVLTTWPSQKITWPVSRLMALSEREKLKRILEFHWLLEDPENEVLRTKVFSPVESQNVTSSCFLLT